MDVALSYQLPIASPSNFKLTFGGQSYAIASDHPRGGGGTDPTTTTPTTTTTSQPSCTVPAWDRAKVYNGGNEVSHGAKRWQAKWWTQGEEPGTTGEWGVWRDLGAC